MWMRFRQQQCGIAEQLSRRRFIIPAFDQHHTFHVLGGRKGGEPAVAIVPQNN